MIGASRTGSTASLALIALLAGSIGGAGANGFSLLGGHRLFTSAEQRARIDALRDAPPPKAVSVAAPQPRSPRPRVRVDGILMRSDGAATHWINGQAKSPLLPRMLDASAPPGAAQLLLARPGSSAIVLRPGERYDPESGTIHALSITSRRARR